MNSDILLTILGGGNLILFIKFLIERHDRKQERAEDKDYASINATLNKLEKDGLRTQLLLLLLMQPDEQAEILTIAEHYFVKPPEGLGGNWYMTGLFAKWCDAHDIEPDWFKRD